MIVVDANVIIAALLENDHFHVRSRDWLGEYLLAGGQLIAPVILLTEVGGGIARRTSDLQGTRAVQVLRNLSSLKLQQVTNKLALEATQLAIDLRLRGADALYVAVALRSNVPLVSWDREHLERAGRRITVYQPQA
jgi:predicted nucleic acid-binding protein